MNQIPDAVVAKAPSLIADALLVIGILLGVLAPVILLHGLDRLAVAKQRISRNRNGYLRKPLDWLPLIGLGFGLGILLMGLLWC